MYGGSFDPIHLGHLAPVEETRRNLSLDAVLFVPAARAPHKPNGTTASAFHRFAMAALAIHDYPRFLLSDLEVARGGTSYTIDTLAQLAVLHEGCELVLMIGSDTLATFQTWRSWREIVERYRLAVVTREPGHPEALPNELPAELRSRLAPRGASLEWEAAGASSHRIFWGENTPVTISSSWIRNKAKGAGDRVEQADLERALPPAVASYLLRHRLYRLYQAREAP